MKETQENPRWMMLQLLNWKILEGYWIPTSMHWHDICDPHLRMMVTLHNHEINGLEPRIPKRNHKSLIRMCFTPIKIFWNTHCFVNFASPKKWYTHLKKHDCWWFAQGKAAYPYWWSLPILFRLTQTCPGMTSTDSTWVRKCEDVWGFSRWHWEFRSHPCSEATQR